MQHLFTQFGLNADLIKSLLDVTDNYIAGSSALYAYQKSINVNPEWMPNDIDIWVRVSSDNLESYKILYKNVLNTQGYKLDVKVKSSNYIYNSYDTIRLNKIKEIASFVKDNRKIQVIFHMFEKVEDNLRDFDLSICSIAWSPKFGFYAGLNILEDIRNMKGFIQVDEIDSRTEQRIEKYKGRGFKIFKKVEL
jgi:hypothetical protein